MLNKMKPVSKEYQEKKGKSNFPLYTNFRRREGKGVTPYKLHSYVRKAHHCACLSLETEEALFDYKYIQQRIQEDNFLCLR